MVNKHMFVVRNIISTVICVLKGKNTFNRQMLSFYTSCTSNNMVHVYIWQRPITLVNGVL
jgi:hypothetical protein